MITGKISYVPNNVSFCNNKKKEKDVKNIWQELGIKEPSPLVQGLGSGALWFGIGYGMDRLLGKCFKLFQTEKEFSLKINAVLGIMMGLCTGIKAAIDQRKAKNNK